jgi:hypothetical protein
MRCVSCDQDVPAAPFCLQCGSFQRSGAEKHVHRLGWFFVAGSIMFFSAALLALDHPNPWMFATMILGGLNAGMMGAQLLLVPQRPKLARIAMYATLPLFAVWIYTLVRLFIK